MVYFCFLIVLPLVFSLSLNMCAFVFLFFPGVSSSHVCVFHKEEVFTLWSFVKMMWRVLCRCSQRSYFCGFTLQGRSIRYVELRFASKRLNLHGSSEAVKIRVRLDRFIDLRIMI